MGVCSLLMSYVYEQDTSEVETSDEATTATNHDDKPIKGVTKTFEQLLEEQLAGEQSAGGQGEITSKKTSVKFLKRGEGLSRFNLKENITPQKEYKPSTKNRQPLVDYSKPILKPKAKDGEAKRKPASQPAKVTKPSTPAVTRKVAAVTAQSPTKPLRRSNTMPVRKPEAKANSLVPNKKLSTQPSSNVAVSKQKTLPTSMNTKSKPQTSIASSTSTTVTVAHSNIASPSKHTTRPSSAMEISVSHIAKPSSPRKRSSLSPRKSSMTSSKPLAIPVLSAVSNSPAAAGKKPVDSSFYANIQDRVQNEAVETEELQVRQ